MSGDDLDNDLHGWLQSEDMNATADYVRRGRQFENLPLSDLIAQWAVTFKDPDEYMRSREHRALSSDYMSEFRLRKIDPPMDLVRADFAKIQKAIKKWMKAMSKEAVLDFAAEVADDLDEFRSKRDRGKH